MGPGLSAPLPDSLTPVTGTTRLGVVGASVLGKEWATDPDNWFWVGFKGSRTDREGTSKVPSGVGDPTPRFVRFPSVPTKPRLRQFTHHGAVGNRSEIPVCQSCQFPRVGYPRCPDNVGVGVREGIGRDLTVDSDRTSIIEERTPGRTRVSAQLAPVAETHRVPAVSPTLSRSLWSY